MKNQKVSTPLGTIVLVIFSITAGVLVWQVMKNREVAETSQEVANIKKSVVTQTPAANQQNQTQQQKQEKIINVGDLYRNDKFAFEFTSPQNLVTTSMPTDSDIVFSDRPGGHWIYDIKISDNPNSLSLENIFNQELNKYNKSGRKIISAVTNVDGKSAKRFSIQGYTDYGNTGVVIINGKNIIIIYGDDSSATNKSNFETIITSFKFIK